jgi:hypothetical protein
MFFILYHIKIITDSRNVFPSKIEERIMEGKNLPPALLTKISNYLDGAWHPSSKYKGPVHLSSQIPIDTNILLTIN